VRGGPLSRILGKSPACDSTVYKRTNCVLSVGHVFDLRSKPEVEKGWKALGAGEGSDGLDVRADWENGMSSVGIDRTWVPVFPEHDYSPERLAERYMVRTPYSPSKQGRTNSCKHQY
jgi:hypothetical protein